MPQKRASEPGGPKKINRGFGAMNAAKQRDIARKGGRVAHEKGTAHQFIPEEAREAGRKGGDAVSRDRHHIAKIGRLGGQAPGQSGANRPPPRGMSEPSEEPEPTRRGEDPETHVSDEIARDVRDEGDAEASDVFW